MAKTNWVLNEIVMPADMNQIGTEINAKAEKNNIETTGYSLRDNRFSKRFLGSVSTINSSPNQKIKITFPTAPTSYNFHGDITLSVGGGYYGTISIGVVSKKLSGSITNSGAVEFESRYTELSGKIFDKIKISDMRFDAVNKQAFILVEYIPNINANQQFSFDIKVNERGAPSYANFKNFFTGITIGSWYADTEVLPPAYVQERQLQLTAPQGTAPLVVTSNTKVENLNSEMINSWRMYRNLSELGISTLSNGVNQILDEMGNRSKLTLDLTNSLSTAVGLPTGGGTLFLNIGETGFRTASATLRNGDYYNGVFSGLIFSSWKQFSLNGSPISSTQLTSTAPQGTAPLVVNSTTKVDKLNSDLFDGWNILTELSELTSYNPSATSMGSLAGLIAAKTILKFHITPSVNPWVNMTNGVPRNEGILELFRLDGTTANFVFTTATSNTVAEKYVGYANQVSNAFVFTGWKQVSLNGSPISSTQLTSTAPQGTAPLVVTSNTKVDNLNSDLVDGFHASQNKDINTLAVRRADGSIQLGGFSNFEQVGFKLPGRNRELRITQDANNISYIQLVNDTGGFIANPIQVNSDGTVGLNVSTNVIAYNNPNTPQVRNTHVGNTAPSNSLGLNGDMYIEV